MERKNKKELELKKLELEVSALEKEKKFWKTKMFWLKIAPATATIIALILAYQSNFFDAKQTELTNLEYDLNKNIKKLRNDSIQFEYRLDSLKKYEVFYKKIQNEYIDSIVEMSLKANNDIIAGEGANFLFARVSYSNNLIYELNYEGVYTSGCPDSIRFILINKEYLDFTISVNKEGCFMKIPKKHISDLSTKDIFKYICFIGDVSWVLDPKKLNFFKQNLTE